VSVNHKSPAAKVTAELHIHLEDDDSFRNATFMVELQLPKL